MLTKKLTHLGGLTAAQFLRDYWQKKPLLVRNAFPDFNGLLPIKDLLTLAQDEDVQSRLIQKQGAKWDVRHGPFNKKTFSSQPQKNWTLLVQELNLHLPAAGELLQAFAFIPHARLDDVMVSYAVEGGGVGAHVDSYDVFLLQGEGRRRWEISNQQDLRLVADAPLKLLQNFIAQTEWTLGPGDMLYLPPRYAHKGTAVTACTTYSIGFRAPSHQELATQFLIYLQDDLALDGMYADADLKTQPHPAEISAAMLKQTTHILKKIKYNQTLIQSFLGSYLTEPKAHIFFDQPENDLSEKIFLSSAHKRGIVLAPPSLMLFRGQQFFINGESFAVDAAEQHFFIQLADTRRAILSKPMHANTVARLCDWYNNGWVRYAD